MFISYPVRVFCYSSRNELRQWHKWGQKYQCLLPCPQPLQAAPTHSSTQRWPCQGPQIKKGRMCPKGALWALLRETGPAAGWPLSVHLSSGQQCQRSGLSLGTLTIQTSHHSVGIRAQASRKLGDTPRGHRAPKDRDTKPHNHRGLDNRP